MRLRSTFELNIPKTVKIRVVICAEYGQPYRRQVWSKYGVKKPVLRCDSRLKHGTKKRRHSPTLMERTLHEAIMETINSVVENQGEFVEAFQENFIQIIGNYSADRGPKEYDGQIDSLQKRMMTLIEESAKLEDTDEEFDRQYRGIEDQIKELKKKKFKQIWEIHLVKSYEQRAQDVDGYIKKTCALKRQFDDDLVRRLIQSIKVINENKIEIQFKAGIVMK